MFIFNVRVLCYLINRAVGAMLFTHNILIFSFPGMIGASVSETHLVQLMAAVSQYAIYVYMSICLYRTVVPKYCIFQAIYVVFFK